MKHNVFRCFVTTLEDPILKAINAGECWVLWRRCFEAEQASYDSDSRSAQQASISVPYDILIRCRSVVTKKIHGIYSLSIPVALERSSASSDLFELVEV